MPERERQFELQFGVDLLDQVKVDPLREKDAEKGNTLINVRVSSFNLNTYIGSHNGHSKMKTFELESECMGYSGNRPIRWHTTAYSKVMLTNRQSIAKKKEAGKKRKEDTPGRGHVCA